MKNFNLINKIAVLTLIFLLIFILFKALFSENIESVNSPLIGKPAPEVSLMNFDGRSVDLNSYSGKILVLNFWASWCYPCKVEAPVLESSYLRWSGQNVEFLAVNVMDEINDAKEYYTTFAGSIPHVYDPDNKIHLDYGVEGVPETYFINRDGIISNKFKGPLDEKTISLYINEAINYQ